MRGAIGAATVLLAACEPRMAATADSPIAPGPYVQVLPVDPVGIRPIPPIPVALRGCWQSEAPSDPEEPGAADRIVVTATTIEQYGSGDQPNVATAEFVERVSETMIEGRFTAPDSNAGRMTLATSLILGPDAHLGLRAGELRRAEGDAGSVHYTRCRS